MSAAEVAVVDRAHWRDHVTGLLEGGFAWLDFLTAIDRGERIEIVIRLMAPSSTEAALAVTSVPADRPDLDSVVPIVPGADWYEREAAEMFGIRFVGHPDPRPLLTRGNSRPPLRKTTPLAARVETAWPGVDPGSRRRSQAPGVLDTWDAS